jgi:inorganic triphosphatase YgiF
MSPRGDARGPSAGGEPTEVEVKLSVARPAVVRRLLHQPQPRLLAGFDGSSPPRRVRVIDRYLETDGADGVDGGLAAAGIRARLRRQGGAAMLTVKRAGLERRGVTTRVELEGPATGALDPARWPSSAARTVLTEAMRGRPIREIARLRQRRLTQRVSRAGTVVELSLDTLEALDAGRVLARRHDLEAELIDGDESALVELADALRDLDGVGPSLGSKMAFALDARAGRPAAACGPLMDC